MMSWSGSHDFAAQRMWRDRDDAQVDETVHNSGIAGEVDDAVIVGTSSKLGFVLLRQTLEQDALEDVYKRQG